MQKRGSRAERGDRDKGCEKRFSKNIFDAEHLRLSAAKGRVRWPTMNSAGGRNCTRSTGFCHWLSENSGRVQRNRAGFVGPFVGQTVAMNASCRVQLPACGNWLVQPETMKVGAAAVS
jgi:hypothetical protein